MINQDEDYDLEIEINDNDKKLDLLCHNLEKKYNNKNKDFIIY